MSNPHAGLDWPVTVLFLYFTLDTRRANLMEHDQHFTRSYTARCMQIYDVPQSAQQVTTVTHDTKVMMPFILAQKNHPANGSSILLDPSVNARNALK